jgi:calcineurin-like phosphoesterase family protein
MAIFYIADMHIGHENVIKHDGRPFKDCEQMHRALIANWNKAVDVKDEVYILGDFAWKSAVGLEVISELVGRKHLILGNHDKPSQSFGYLFESVADYAVIEDEGSQVVLSHYPIAHWYNQYRGAVHLYGHVHNTKDYDAFQRYAGICRELNIPFESYNVGCMMPYMNYTPRTLTEIRKENGYEL